MRRDSHACSGPLPKSDPASCRSGGVFTIRLRFTTRRTSGRSGPRGARVHPACSGQREWSAPSVAVAQYDPRLGHGTIIFRRAGCTDSSHIETASDCLCRRLKPKRCRYGGCKCRWRTARQQRPSREHFRRQLTRNPKPGPRSGSPHPDTRVHCEGLDAPFSVRGARPSSLHARANSLW
jgi:hypothetical protein